MAKRFALVTLMVCCSYAPGGGLCLPAWGQEATEVFIPIGESPGVSGETSLIGTIRSVDREARILEVVDESGTHRVELTDRTPIWIDRSASRRTSQRGSLANCAAGERCEVKLVYENGVRTMRAEWVKVRPVSSGFPVPPGAR